MTPGIDEVPSNGVPMPLRSTHAPTPEQDRRHALLEDLLGKAVAGDEQSLNQLLEELLPRLRDQVRRSLNIACRHAQSDVLCSVIRRVLEQSALPPTLQLFLGRVGMIVRNRCHDEYRKWVKRPAPLGHANEVADNRETPEEAASREEAEAARKRLVDLLPVAMQLLPEHYREILEHTYYGGMSSKDIGARMELSEGNVRVLRYRALKELRQLLENPDANE
jgi:RNA polymerase sigma factor (sigma-70 family)